VVSKKDREEEDKKKKGLRPVDDQGIDPPHSCSTFSFTLRLKNCNAADFLSNGRA
jgi:hypothetical protein